MLLLLFSPFFLPWRDSDVLEISGETAHLSIFTPSVPAAKVEAHQASCRWSGNLPWPLFPASVGQQLCRGGLYEWIGAVCGWMWGSISGHSILSALLKLQQGKPWELCELLGGFAPHLVLFTAHKREAKEGMLDLLMHRGVSCAKRSPPTSRNKREKNYQTVFMWLRPRSLSTRLAQIAAASAFFTLEIKA